MKPDAELPGDFEVRKGHAMIPSEGVVRIVARAPDFAEKLVDLVGEDSVILEPG